MAHREFHRTEHIGWLRASVLGANDGLISTSSLVVGVAAANPAPGAVLVASPSRASASTTKREGASIVALDRCRSSQRIRRSRSIAIKT